MLIRATSGFLVWRGPAYARGTPAHRIHRTIRRATWLEESPSGRALLVVGLLLWPAATALLCVWCTARAGWGVQALTGKGLLRQASEQLRLSFRLGIPAFWYYVFDLYEDARRARAHEYLLRLETKTGLYPLLRRYLSSSTTTEALRDKARFGQRCAVHGVPAVPALAVVERCRITRLDGGAGGLPHTDLFVKPLSGAGGRDASIWRRGCDGTYVSDTGETASEMELIERLSLRSRDQAWVLRPCVENHPEIARLGPGALSTVRVLTCLDERGRPEVTHAVLRMARTRAVVVDNFHAGGIAAKVDLATGVLGAALDGGRGRDRRAWDVHPLTGERISGRRLPMWPQVLDLARRAHAVFPDQIAVGWDIAILPDGPRLIEGNKSPDLDIVQRTHGEPLGNSRLGELLAFHMDRALERRRARGTPPRRA